MIIVSAHNPGIPGARAERGAEFRPVRRCDESNHSEVTQLSLRLRRSDLLSMRWV